MKSRATNSKAVLFLVYLMISSALYSQGKLKRTLTEGDYHKWSTLKMGQLSPKGKWVSYKLSYESKKDTLYLQNIAGAMRYSFPGATDGEFSADDLFVVSKGDSLLLFDTRSAKTQGLAAVIKHEVLSEKGYILTIERTPLGQSLFIRDRNLKILKVIKGGQDFKWDGGTTVGIVVGTGGENSVMVLHLGKHMSEEVIIEDKPINFSDLTFQANGNSIAFYGGTPITSNIYYFDVRNKKLDVLNFATERLLPYKSVDSGMNSHLLLSNDGTKVFFEAASARTIEPMSSNPEIWYSEDKVLYPNRKLRATVTRFPITMAWSPLTNKVTQVSNEKQLWVTFTGKQTHALLADPLTYEPQYQWIADRDFYLMDLESGEKELFLTKQSGLPSALSVSPNANYIAYYKKGNWWLFNLITKKHENITSGLDASWDNAITDPGNETHVWGNAGWSSDGKWVLIFDYYDVWAISIDAKVKNRLTNGRGHNMRFRFFKPNQNGPSYNPNGTPASSVEIDGSILTGKSLQDNSSGYYRITGTLITPIIKSRGELGALKVSKDKKTLAYIEQAYDTPPAIMLFQNSKKGIKKIFESNRHHQKFMWGHSKMVHYRNSEGYELNAALFFPAGYTPDKTYPLVVNIYETLSQNVNRYINPSLHNPLGFNISNLTSKGYFVLLPDIVYRKGQPGKSATDCTLAAVKETCAKFPIDHKRIALVGHSFGAYETNFIITQTNLFCAAVSGCGVSDIVSHYFTYNTEQGSPDLWRYENQQYRMGTSFFLNRDLYLENSPLWNASQIHTPLLTWAGEQDSNVMPAQSKILYLALRRQQKKNIMLIYQNDGHIISKPNNQLDLTHKLQDWLDYYLKSIPLPTWMDISVQ